MRKVLLIGVFAGLLTSCDSNVVQSDTQSIASAVWEQQDTISFAIQPKDSLQPYDMFLQVRNTNDYPFNNLFLIVSMEFPHGKVVTDTLEYKMANPDGSWLGTGFGSVKENKLWYKEGITFFEDGDYTLRITHAVRNNGEVDGVTALSGISDVGYSIEADSE
ncbi:gliding motility lipoprotein GldH [Altibacter sp. HG106]|uniref:gliding motility lipoprotein GldH n=1 Tax=Altibacter sp. HG106 TaxID=3023937 RepID=UPI002350B8A4|nr:gliding motility lipoprotein GldH [Altibacter sp. HG106]MDC7995051.1 gliding motility lipoprotein GldH [Altibacter sp. HG106]